MIVIHATEEILEFGYKALIWTALILLFFAGCAPVISKELRKEVVKEIHLWRPDRKEKVYPCPSWHYPWRWYHPYHPYWYPW